LNEAPGKRLVPACIAVAALCLMGMPAVSAADQADATVPDTATAAATPDPASAAPAPDAAKPRLHRQAWPRSGTQTFERRIEWMSRQLMLDATQQAQLRELLIEQQREIRHLWASNPNPMADRTGATLAIERRTQDRIRAMLNDEQRSHYPAAIPRDELAPAQADANHWIELSRQPAPRPAPGPPH
jgi:Spy/CpxP family protein refolding chaperone